MYDAYGKLIVNVQDVVKAESEKEALQKLILKLNPDTIKRIKIEIEDADGNIHKLYIDEVVELEWSETQEAIPEPDGDNK